MPEVKNSFLYFVNAACCFCLHKYKLKIKLASKINKSDKNMPNNDMHKYANPKYA